MRQALDEGVRRTRQSNSRLERFHGGHHATHGSFVIQRIPTAADVCESLESFSRFRRYRASHRSEFQSFRAIVSVRFSTSDERPVAGNAIGRETVVVGRKERESSMGEVKKISRGVRRERLGSFGEFHKTRMSKSGARNRKNTTKKSLDDDDDDDFSFDENEESDDLEGDGESKRSSYLNDFDRARGVTKAEKLRRENAFEYFRDFSRKSAKGVKTLVEDVFCSSKNSKYGQNHRNFEEEEDDKEKENQTDTSSESPAVDAVEDALRFLFSKDGKIVRDNVVEDALDALEAFFDDSDDDDHPKDDSDTFDVNDDVEKKKAKKKESVGDQITLDQLLLAFKATQGGDCRPPGLMDPSRRQIRLRKGIRGHGVYVSFRNARARA